MKKLKLKLNGFQPMSKDDMKKINGGYTSCSVDCSFTGGYACCSSNYGLVANCFCIENGHSPAVGQCDGGGPGAFWCAIVVP